jgi:hypothetical protein
MVKREVKWKMIEGLDKEELVTLKLSKKQVVEDLTWKHAKEFEYKGEMYDVVLKNDLGDSVEFVLWWDYEETHLNQQLQALVSFKWLHHPAPNKTKQSVQLLMKSLFFVQKSSTHSNNLQATHRIFIDYSNQLPAGFMELHLLPPELF